MLNFLLGNDLLSSIVAFALILIPTIIIHELGHFLAAKAVGITVLEFGIGFPPRFARLFTWGGTEFTLNWIPLGGFVRPFGEDLIRPLSEEEVEQERKSLTDAPGTPDVYQEERDVLRSRGITKAIAVNEVKPLPRIFFMAGGAIANFISAFVLFVVIGLIGLPEVVGGRINLIEVPPDSAFAAAGLQSNDLIEAVNGENFADSQAFFARLNALRGQEVLLTVLRPETGETLQIPFTMTEELNADDRLGYVRVLAIAENSPAHLAGLQADDLIVAFNGQPLTRMDDPTTSLQEMTTVNAGQAVTLTVLRNDERLDITLTPREDPPPNEGRIGIQIGTEFRSQADNGLVYTEGPPKQALVSQPFGASVEYGVQQTASVFGTIAEVPSRIIQGTMTAEEARPVSIIGISKWGGQILQHSIVESQPVSALNYVAIISILLGITNLLPLPALDGGRIAFVLIEIIRGRPISPEREGLVHLIGFAFILSIGLIFMLNDILNPLPSILP